MTTRCPWLKDNPALLMWYCWRAALIPEVRTLIRGRPWEDCQ